MSEVVRRVVIRGRVQGVGYRAWVEDEAQARGLAGWVRNRRDGCVEAVFGGGEGMVADMIAACHRGPAAARVTAVELHAADAQALAPRVAGERFSVLGTA